MLYDQLFNVNENAVKMENVSKKIRSVFILFLIRQSPFKSSNIHGKFVHRLDSNFLVISNFETVILLYQLDVFLTAH